MSLTITRQGRGIKVEIEVTRLCCGLGVGKYKHMTDAPGQEPREQEAERQP